MSRPVPPCSHRGAAYSCCAEKKEEKTSAWYHVFFLDCFFDRCLSPSTLVVRSFFQILANKQDMITKRAYMSFLVWISTRAPASPPAIPPGRGRGIAHPSTHPHDILPPTPACTRSSTHARTHAHSPTHLPTRPPTHPSLAHSPSPPTAVRTPRWSSTSAGFCRTG